MDHASIALGVVMASCGLSMLIKHPDWLGWLIIAVTCTTCATLAFTDLHHAGADGYGAIMTLFAVGAWAEFWRNRPRGKGRKAAKLIGAKARAVRDAMIAKMPTPRRLPATA